ncbi:11038_t:CDS:1, partial [Acaulospora morrowiae]
GIRVPELKSCPKCREEILSNPPQSITILSCDHVFHRACIEKDILYSTPGEARCPIFGCHRDIETIKIDLSLLEPAKSTQQSADTVEGIYDNETTSNASDIAEVIIKDKTPKLPVPTWIKEKLNAKNNNHEFMKALGLLDESLEVEQVLTTNRTSADKGKVRVTIEATSANEEQEREHNTLNKEKSQQENITSDHEKTITPTASVRDSTTEKPIL